MVDMSKLDEKIQNSPLTVFTTEDELAYMKKHREKIVQKVGQDKYDSLVSKLEDYIRNRKQPQSASNSEL